MDLELAGRVALVTGAAAGIGRGIVDRFAQEGATIFFTDISEQLGAEAQRALTAHGAKAHFIQHDVLDVGGWARVFETVRQSAGRLDALVNNGYAAAPGDIERLTLEDWRKTFAGIADSTFLACQGALPLMEGGGAIVNIASIGSIRAAPGALAYASAKSALRAFSQTMAKDLAARNIRVNVIHPGLIESAGLLSAAKMRNLPEDQFLKAAAMGVPLGRVGKPSDIGDAVAFLCSPRGGYITGAELVIDGGLTIKHMT